MDHTTNYSLYQYQQAQQQVAAQQQQQQYQYQGLQQYQQAIQFALQNPKLGPLQWPGGYHPQHTHTLTYAKIFAGGLKRDTDRKTLMRYFTKFGQVKRVDLVMDPRNPGKNRGFAFVQFEGIDGCERACTRGQFHNIDGHDVEVKRAVLKPPGSGSETAGIGIDPTAYGMMGQYYGVTQQQQQATAGQPAMYQPQETATPNSTEGATSETPENGTSSNESPEIIPVTATTPGGHVDATGDASTNAAAAAAAGYYYQADPSQQAYGQYQTTPQYAMVQSVSPYGYSPYAIATPTSPTNESMCASQAGEYFQWTQHPQTSLMTDSSMMNLSQNEQSILSQSPSKASGSQEQ